MVTHSKPRRKAKDEELKSVPSPEQVRAMAAEIRKSWSPSERRRRAALARFAVLRELIGGEW
jgi:hypothetical protein